MKEFLTAFFLEASLRVIRLIPTTFRFQCLQWIGGLYGSFPHAQRKNVEKNFHLLFSKTPDLLHSNNINSVFRNFAVTLFDFASADTLTVTVPRKIELEEWRARFGGMMMLTFHMGLWELGARIMARWGWPVTAIYQPYTNPHLKKTIESRRAPGVEFIPVGQGAAQAVSRVLKDNRIVAMLGDHSFGEDGMTVNVMGEKVTWAKGPILLAVKSKVPIIVSCVIRTAPSTYEAIVLDPIVPKEKSSHEIERVAQVIADKFSDLLRKYPTQWYYFASLQPDPHMIKSTGASVSQDEVRPITTTASKHGV